jgi:RNA 3'-terminal phosphate cyclase (ATP)
MKALASQLADLPIKVDTAQVEIAGPGNVATVTLRAAHVTETFTGFGEHGIRAEKVACLLAGEVRKYLHAGVPVGPYLADQLLIPLALAGGGELRTTEPTLHTRTNLEVIERFLSGRLWAAPDTANIWTVRAS